MQRCELIVTDRERLVKNLKENGWTYYVNVSPKLPLKNVPVFLPQRPFLGVSRANLREEEPDVFTP